MILRCMRVFCIMVLLFCKAHIVLCADYDCDTGFIAEATELEQLFRDDRQGGLQSPGSTDSSADPDLAPSDAALYVLGSRGKTGKAAMRRTRLVERLKAGPVRFADVRAEYYGGGESVFHSDILDAMYHSVDVYKEKGSFYCLPYLRKNIKPLTNIEIAMFNLLKEDTLSWFDVCFALYRQGCRESPEFLRNLEAAIFVANARPRGCKIFIARDAKFHASAQTILSEICGLSRQDFELYMRNIPEQHVGILQHRRHKAVVRHLWTLNNNGSLTKLKSMKAAMHDVPEDCDDSEKDQFAWKFFGTQAQQIMMFLRKRVNQELPVQDSLEKICAARNSNESWRDLLRVVLMLGTHEPIIYNKAAQTMKLLCEPIPILQPEENTNLFTMVYDVIRRTPTRPIREEFAYHACRGGYWKEGFSNPAKEEFFALITRYRVFLAIMGYVGIDVCTLRTRPQVQRCHAMWCLKETERGLKYPDDLGGLLPFTQPEDMKVMSDLHAFTQSAEFSVFRRYTRRLLTEAGALIAEHLRKQPLLGGVLWGFCHSVGLQTVEQMWEVAGDLTQREEGGRLIYDQKTGVFSWRDVALPQPEEESLVAAVFFFKHQEPKIKNMELCYMLQQDGFQNMTPVVVSAILQGLGVLGFYYDEEETYVGVRSAVNKMLTQEKKLQTNLHKQGELLQHSQLAKRVVRWVHNGSFDKLWVAYQDTKRYIPKKNTLLQGDGPPEAKRLKVAQPSCPDDVILFEIPALHAILMNKNTAAQKTP